MYGTINLAAVTKVGRRKDHPSEELECSMMMVYYSFNALSTEYYHSFRLLAQTGNKN